MILQILVLIMSIIITALAVWIIVSKVYQKQIDVLKNENYSLKSQIQVNENIINSVKAEFTKIAQESLKNQQEQLLNEHSVDLKHKFDLFKSEEINPLSKLLKDFKDTIDNYQKSHQMESLEIKNAVSTAEKYAKALTTNQNSRGEFGEDWLEQILKFSGLSENVHYSKQFVSSSVKPDFMIYLPDDKHLIIDSKVILKNYIDYCNNEDENLKKSFIGDLINCINSLAKKNYEEIEETNQPGFILTACYFAFDKSIMGFKNKV